MKRLSFLQSLAMLGLWIGLSGFLLFLLSLGRERVGINLTEFMVAQGGGFVGTVLLCPRLCGVSWQSLLTFGPMPWRVAPAVVLMVLGAIVLSAEVINVTYMFLPKPKGFGESFRLALDAGNPIVTALTLAVVAPLSEELLIRNWMLGSLLRRWKPWRAIAVSAVIFGAIHLNPWKFIHTTLLGLSLGWIFWRTGALWLCVLAHGLFNFLVWMFALLLNDRGTTGDLDSPPALLPLWLDAGALAVFVAGAWWLVRHTSPPAWADPLIDSRPKEVPPVLPPALPPHA